ncbi:mucin-5AC-like isoform X3 [Oncorhynchus masou masou]
MFHSRMEAETQAEVQLVFNETSTQSVPEVTDISNTLKEAVTNPNTFFGNLSVDVTTIIVKAAPATSTVPPTTSVTTTVAGTTTTTTGEPVTVPATVPTTRPTTTTTTYVAPTTTVSRTTSPLSTTSTASTTTTNATTTTTTPTTTTSTATTTTATTTTTTAHLKPVPRVSFVIQQVFVEALNDPQSTQFQELAVTITAVFDVIYKAKYGILFIRTIVLGFTPMFHSRMEAETQAEVQLVFNETSTQSVPEVTDISNTLKEAVTNPNTFFGNLSVDVTTIIVKAAPATSTVPPTTSVTTTVAGTTATTTGERVPVPATVPTTRPTTTTTTYVAPTTTVSRTTSPLSTTSTASTTTTNATNTTTTHTTTTSTTTTTTATTTTTTAHLQPAPLVSFVIQQVFVEALNDPQSTQFQELAITITAVFDVIYKAKYGILFIRTIVLGFTPMFHSRMDAETLAEVQLVFNETSTQSVPEVTDISNTLKEAVTNPNITFGNLSVDVTTIIVQVPTTSKNTTTTASPVITTAIITTTTTETTVVALTKVTVVFRSSGETFTSDLSNTSSQACQTRALLIKTQLDPFYRSAFTSFNSLAVTEFSSGSIINTMDLAFSSPSVPNSMEIGTVLIKAAQKITAFNIDPTSVRVNGTAVTSSGVSSKTSLCTAFFLVVLSLLLSSQH